MLFSLHKPDLDPSLIPFRTEPSGGRGMDANDLGVLEPWLRGPTKSDVSMLHAGFFNGFGGGFDLSDMDLQPR